MGFIKKMGSRGGFYGPLYIKSAQRGRLAYMHDDRYVIACSGFTLGVADLTGKFGFDDGVGGTIDPTHTNSGYQVTEFSVTNPGDQIVLEFDNGVQHGTVVSVNIGTKEIELTWNATTGHYEGTEPGVGQEVADAVGTDVCVIVGDVFDPPIVFHAATYNTDTFESLQMLVGTPPATSTHTATIYAPDHEGVYRAFEENEPVWEGGRVAFNEIPEDRLGFVGSGWNSLPTGTGSTAVITSGGFSDPHGGTAASRIQLDLNGGTGSGDRSKTMYTTPANDTKVFSMWLKSATGSPYRVQIAGNILAVVDVTDEWQRFSWTTPSPSAFWTVGVQLQGNTAGISDSVDVHAYFPQSELSFGVSDQTLPSENIVGTKAFATTNGNSVTDKVVTEATGTLLDPLPMLVYQKAATNNLIESWNFITGWTLASAPVLALDATGLDGTLSSAYSIEDDSPTEFASISKNTPGFSALNVATAVFHIEKSANETSFPEFEFRNGDSAERISVQINKSTGESAQRINAGTTRYVVVDAIKWWVVCLEVANSTAQNQTYAHVYPARGLTLGGTDVSAVGKVNVPNIGVYLGKTLEEVKYIGPIQTNGTAVSTDEIITTWAAANHSDAGDSYEIIPRLTGEDQVLLSMGGTAVLEVGDGGIGPEHMINGDFATGDLTGWIAAVPPATGVVTNYQLVTERNSGGAVSSPGQTVTGLTIGKAYWLSIEVIASNTSIGMNVTNQEEGNLLQPYTPSSGTGVFGWQFTPTNTSVTITPRFPTNSNGVATLDNFSVTEYDRVIRLTDGTNSCSNPVVSAEPHIIATYNATDGMTLDVDGVTATSAYDGTLGSGDLSTQATQRDLIRRWS